MEQSGRTRMGGTAGRGRTEGDSRVNSRGRPEKPSGMRSEKPVRTRSGSSGTTGGFKDKPFESKRSSPVAAQRGGSSPKGRPVVERSEFESAESGQSEFLSRLSEFTEKGERPYNPKSAPVEGEAPRKRAPAPRPFIAKEGARASTGSRGTPRDTESRAGSPRSAAPRGAATAGRPVRKDEGRPAPAGKGRATARTNSRAGEEAQPKARRGSGRGAPVKTYEFDEKKSKSTRASRREAGGRGRK